MDTDSILNEVMISVMNKVGGRFSEGELFVPEMLRAAMEKKAFADQIGADGYSDDAPGGVELVRKLVGI